MSTNASTAANEAAAFPTAKAVAARIASKRCRGFTHEAARAIADANNGADEEWFYGLFPAFMARESGYEVNGDTNGWVISVDDEDGQFIGFL